MVKLLEDMTSVRSLEPNESFFATPPQSKKLGNFVLDQNGQIDINRKGIESSYGFRLQELNHNTEICSSKDLCDETATSVSGYSNYKQRIDSMFDDSRSVISEMSRDLNRETRGSKSLIDGKTNLLKHYEKRKEKAVTNNIQEKIEKMFEDISVQGFQRSSSFNDLKGRKRNSVEATTYVQNTLSHSFKVIYLGAKPLQDKTVSLISLQDPLRELYFEYKANRKENQVNILSISREGLKIKIADKEQLNPFPTIAVWASVKLVFRNESNTTEYAFLPLIKDPDGIDKNTLFRELTSKDKSVILDGKQGKIDENISSPIFTVVMKNNDLNKQLECHGFISTSSEEAIIIAANLYQALMKKMKRKKDGNDLKLYDSDKSRDSEATQTEAVNVEKKKTPPPVPKRPPRRDKRVPDVKGEIQKTESKWETSSRASDREEKDVVSELNAIQKQEKIENKFQRRGSVPTNVYGVEHESMRTLRRTASERGSNGIVPAEPPEGGDILTKVAIPRSRSFLNANGPLTRYSRRYKANTQNAIESPLGFTELFNEFRLNEGLESMDDILNAIIDAEGMSFNDLKPIYKEFLLKLAGALTKDELYQRSKIIMRRQKKKSQNCNGKKKTFISTTRISKVFKKTASKLRKGKNTRPTNLEFTSVVFQSGNKRFEASTSSASSCRRKQKLSPKRRQSTRRRANKKLERKRDKHLTTTSEESDFFSARIATESGGGPNRSSSGYFSCSECSYDSENCTCTSADKCYCTLGQKKIRTAKYYEKDKSNPNPIVDLKCEKDKTSMKSCACDTESCENSEKCYCNNSNKYSGKSSGNTRNTSGMRTKIVSLADVKGVCQTPHRHDIARNRRFSCSSYSKESCDRHNQSLFEQLKEQGFAASDSSLSRAASPSTAWRNNEERTRKPKDCLKASRSLEFLQMRPRQQINECPTPPGSSRLVAGSDKYLLKEIQNTAHHSKFVEGTRHFCYHGQDVGRVHRCLSLQHDPSVSCPRTRRYSSMRSRLEPPLDFFDSGSRGKLHRARNIFSSMRSKPTSDNIFNHVKFPNASSRNGSLRFTRRMDVYDSFAKRGRDLRNQSYVETVHQTRRKLTERNENYTRQSRLCDSRRQCQRGDNFYKLDCDLFTSGKSETSDAGSSVSDRKVLVVSARDPTGKVLYMGASSRGENSSRRFNNYNGYLRDNAGNACEALSVKKSAEIAALFSDVSLKTKLYRAGHFRTDKYYPDYKDGGYRNTNLENTLGYLP